MSDSIETTHSSNILRSNVENVEMEKSSESSYERDLMQISKYFNRTTLSDVHFVFPTTGESTQTIPAHRLILALRSTAFEKAFSGNKTKVTNLPLKISVRDTGYSVFLAMLKFVYTNEFSISEDSNLTEMNSLEYALELLRAAIVYKVPSLCQLCADVAISAVDTNNVMTVLVTADFIGGYDRQQEKQGGDESPSSSISKNAIRRLEEHCEKWILKLTYEEFEKVIYSSAATRCSTKRMVQLFCQYSAAPLVLAVKLECFRVVDALIEEGYSIDQTDEDGVVPLVVAMELGNDRIVRRLLLGKNVEQFNKNGSLLHLAAWNGSVVHCKILLESGVPVNGTNSTEKNDEDGTDSGRGQTPLHIASQRGHFEIVRLLIEHGAVPNLQDMDGNTPLHYAENEEVAKLLLPIANLSIPNKRGRVPLHLAAERGDVHLASILLSEGAQQDVTDDQGQNPIHSAAAAAQPSVLLILLKAAEDQALADRDSTSTNSASFESKDPPTQTSTTLDPDVNLPLLSIDINAPDAKGNTALHLAAMSSPSGCEKVIRILLENGADPNIGNWIGHTPLHLFCSHQDGPSSVIDSFIEHKVDIHAQGADGSTPIHLAVGRGSLENTVALVRHGSWVHICDAANRTVIDLAETVAKGSLVVPLLRNISTLPPWVPDEAVDECLACGNSFSVATRKHHCRHCGRVICHNCSSNFSAIPKFNITKPTRVCQLCYDVLSFRKLI